ncbi:telomere repeat-binding factor 4-like [Salvia divinorum]|uniref:MYB transcription factor n=1 Tax=Salvia divinorum TaxID=28513 RepID=A0ABD1FIL5_SALDI
MGDPKQKWIAEEEEALRAGVAKHGAGKWKNIQRDPEFNHLLSSRSNIDLKDKWRNLGPANGQGPRVKSKATKGKLNPAEAPATPLPIAQTLGSVALSSKDASTDVVMIDSSRPFSEGINSAKYNTMVFEASSTLKDLNGLDSSAIASFIEQRHEVPQTLRRALTSRLRTLVQQDNLEKVQNCYKIKNSAALDTRPSAPRQKDLQPRPIQSIGCLGDIVEELAASAAYQIAEAENKSFVAAESVKEAERVVRMAEDMESLLQFAMDCFDQTTGSRGEILLMA